MKNEDELVIQFCAALAGARELFRAAHIYVEKKPYVKNATTTVSHARGNFNEALLKGQPTSEERVVYGVEISYSLDADLREMIDNDKYSLGASVAARSLGDHWLLQGEVGWSCTSCGWEDHDCFEENVESAQAVLIVLPAFCEKVLLSYRAFVDSQKLATRK
jgi:hypothetical protein